MREEMERAKFCAEICSAAERTGIKLGYFGYGKRHRYVWADRLVGAIIEGKVNKTKEDALESACESLVHYLNVRPHGEQESVPVNGHSVQG